MNENPMNQDTNENKSDTPSYEVYSREYTPGRDRYNEYTRSYTSGIYPEPPKNRNKKRTGVGSIAIIALALLVSMLLGAGVMLGVGRAVNIFFNESATHYPLDTEQNQTIDTNDEVPESIKTPGNDADVFFGSEEDTKINVSNSEGITTGGSVGAPGMSYADVATLVKDSVVEITTSETSYNGMIYENGAGSGVIVKESGIIITNTHVIDGASYITVRLTNGSTYNAVPVASDTASDIAILKIEPTEKLTVAVFGNSDTLVVGEEVMAIGNPLGVLGGTVTNGIVSALEREVTIDNEKMILLQHNAAVSPGNSGGALFNMRGELIGIVNAKSSREGAEGIGFAIPINTVLSVYNDLVSVGYVKGRPDSGLTLQTVVKRVGYFYYEYEVCIMASRYNEEFKAGDIILSIDGIEPANITEAEYLLSGHEIGDKVTIVVSRADGTHSIELIIREYTPIQ